MKQAILAVIVALGLGAAFILSASLSVAGPNDVGGNYIDEPSDGSR